MVSFCYYYYYYNLTFKRNIKITYTRGLKAKWDRARQSMKQWQLALRLGAIPSNKSFWKALSSAVINGSSLFMTYQEGASEAADSSK